MPETPTDYFPNAGYSTVQFNFVEEYEFAVREIEFAESRRRQASIIDSRPRRRLQAQMLLSAWDTEESIRNFMTSHSGPFVPFWVYGTQRRKFTDYQIGTGNGTNDYFPAYFYYKGPGLANGLNGNPNLINVKVNGVLQYPSVDYHYTVSSDVTTFLEIIFEAGHIPGNGLPVTITVIGRPRIAVKWEGTVYHQEHPLRVPERRDYMAEMVTLPLVEVF